MNKVLVIGAGGVGTVVVNKLAQHVDVFNDITVATRTLSKCKELAEDIKKKIFGKYSCGTSRCG